MLNTFPQLLTYQLFAPTLLRIAAAFIFAYLAYRHYEKREAIARIDFPIVGRGMWIVWVAVVVEAVVAAGLFFGYHTQIAAIIGILAALKQWFWRGKYPAFFWLTRSTSFLLLVICISLLLTGAGLVAFDIPGL